MSELVSGQWYWRTVPCVYNTFEFSKQDNYGHFHSLLDNYLSTVAMYEHCKFIRISRMQTIETEVKRELGWEGRGVYTEYRYGETHRDREEKK